MDFDLLNVELEDIDKRIIELKYIDKSSFSTNWEQVARQVGYDKTSCIRRKNKAAKKIEIVLKGVI